MVNNALFNDLKILSEAFYKILEIDLNTDLYYEVKIQGKDRSKHKLVQKWVKEFVDNSVHPDDKKRFIDFFNAEKTKDYLKTHWMKRIFYRRKVDKEWRICCVEVVKMDNYSDDDAIVLLTVRDIDDYVKDFREQIDKMAPEKKF